jgi:Holliday junction resolvase-like predicted endonuclease
MVGYDGSVLAFVEVKTRTMPDAAGTTSPQTIQRTPEDAVKWEKRRNLSRMARQFLRARHIESAECRFDVLLSKHARAPSLWCACTKPRSTPSVTETRTAPPACEKLISPAIPPRPQSVTVVE